MSKYAKTLFSLIMLVCTGLAGHAQFYQGSQNEFGKNRVQYRSFLWQQYRFENFDTYFYEGGQQLAAFTSKVAEKNIRSLEDMFDYPMSEKVQFIVYNSHTDFKQSNVGITGDEQYNIGGSTRIVGSKVFVYFEGDYIKFEQSIRHGIALVLINQILYGGNWRDVIKNSTLLTLPEWYIDGLIIYASKNMDKDVESRIRSGILSGAYEKFNRLEGRDAEIAGYALWRYVADVYGDNIIPNILYMSRVSRNVESGFLFVLGKSLATITQEFIAYNKGEYAVADLTKSAVNLEELPIKTKKDRVYTQFEINPTGTHATYVSNIMGQYRLYLYDIEKKKRKKILKAEHKLERIPDYSFPVIAWHPSGEVFSYVTEKRGQLKLNTYNLEDKKTVTRDVFQLDKILSMEYSPNGQQMVFSGVDNGQTDIYLYYSIGNRQERLTNDMYDDFDPSFSMDGNRVLFSSNRPDDTLRTGATVTEIPRNLDVFAYNLTSRSPNLERITDTPDLIERNPYQYDSVRYTFTADYQGTINRYVATYDSTISRIDTTVHYSYFTTAVPVSDYRMDLLNYAAHPRTGNFATYVYDRKKYRFYTGNFRDDLFDEDGNAIIARPLETEESDDSPPREPYAPGGDVEKVEHIVIESEPEQESEVDIDNYTFEGERNFNYEQETITITEVPGSKKPYKPSRESSTKLDSLALPGARNYNINFTTDYVLAQADNTFMTDFYQPLSGTSNLNPGLSGLFKFGASDLFEDYKIVGGFRIPLNFDNSAYMLSGENLSKRIDKRIQLFRQANRFQVGQNVVKLITYHGAYRMSYPINEVFSLRGTGMYRLDQSILLATDPISLESPSFVSHYMGLKGEMVFDNTLGMGLNLYRGMRWKVWGEYYRDPFNFERDFFVMGLDARHYTKIHRQLIWANRVAYSSSIGRERLLFFLGGVDNWLFPKSDESVPIDFSQNYQFQTLGSPMRGFFYNSRNGNSFAVVNSEIRWPIFRYLFNRPLRSDFLENFQIVAFGDMGSAWTGASPFAEENAFNSTIIRRGDVTIEVQNNRNPVVFGYGTGLRSRLLGYFVRVDWAWGIDDGIVLPSVFYLSLSLDF